MNQVTLLEDGNKFGRRKHAEPRIYPPNQSFQAAYFSRKRANKRLVIDLYIPLLHSLSDMVHNKTPAKKKMPKLFIIVAIKTFSLSFYAVTGNFRPVTGIDNISFGGNTVNSRLKIQGHRNLQLQKSFVCLRYRFRTISFRRKNGKLIRKHTRNQSSRKTAIQNLRHLHKKSIPGLEAETVVVQLKVHNIKIAKNLPFFDELRCQFPKSVVLYRLTERIPTILFQLISFFHPLRNKRALIFVQFGSLR